MLGEIMENNKDFFAKNKYFYHKNAISKELALMGTQYAIFDALDWQEENGGDQAQVPGSHSKYADPFMEALLLKLHKTVEQDTGLELFPTYSYYRLYKPGDSLAPHVDRPACEISLTVNLGYFYNTEDQNYSWDIVVNNQSFKTEPGDMVIYRGLEMEHWRDTFVCGEGSWQVQAFLHYVDANGPYAMCKWDARPAPGLSPALRQQSLIDMANYVHQQNKERIDVTDSVIYVEGQ